MQSTTQLCPYTEVTTSARRNCLIREEVTFRGMSYEGEAATKFNGNICHGDESCVMRICDFTTQDDRVLNNVKLVCWSSSALFLFIFCLNLCWSHLIELHSSKWTSLSCLPVINNWYHSTRCHCKVILFLLGRKLSKCMFQIVHLTELKKCVSFFCPFCWLNTGSNSRVVYNLTRWKI